MFTLITGGSKCGRSALGEKILDGFAGEKYYIATMQPYGAEAEKAIARHRKMREGKGFQTVEQYTDLAQLDLPEGCAVLLECTANLTANEMFTVGITDPVDKILADIGQLSQRAAQLVVIHSEVGADGSDYQSETTHYIAAMGRLGQALASRADNVVECVYSIPVIHKGEIPCC